MQVVRNEIIQALSFLIQVMRAVYFLNEVLWGGGSAEIKTLLPRSLGMKKPSYKVIKGLSSTNYFY